MPIKIKGLLFIILLIFSYPANLFSSSYMRITDQSHTQWKFASCFSVSVNGNEQSGKYIDFNDSIPFQPFRIKVDANQPTAQILMMMMLENFENDSTMYNFEYTFEDKTDYNDSSFKKMDIIPFSYNIAFDSEFYKKTENLNAHSNYTAYYKLKFHHSDTYIIDVKYLWTDNETNSIECKSIDKIILKVDLNYNTEKQADSAYIEYQRPLYIKQRIFNLLSVDAFTKNIENKEILKQLDEFQTADGSLMDTQALSEKINPIEITKKKTDTDSLKIKTEEGDSNIIIIKIDTGDYRNLLKDIIFFIKETHSILDEEEIDKFKIKNRVKNILKIFPELRNDDNAQLIINKIFELDNPKDK